LGIDDFLSYKQAKENFKATLMKYKDEFKKTGIYENIEKLVENNNNIEKNN